uniref:Uncharacterized protein n=1 Tax=Amphimedon queenslandica TaxID=400682 RepID=A0A1X7VG42_AMPQE
MAAPIEDVVIEVHPSDGKRSKGNTEEEGGVKAESGEEDGKEGRKPRRKRRPLLNSK